MSVANWLTALRIVLIPVFIWILLQGYLLWALAAFLMAALTDVLDGFIARRTKTTTLGRFLDPAADKLMLVSAFIVLPLIKLLPAWVTMVVVSRDVIISLGYLVLYMHWGSSRIAVRPLGKITTFIQCLGVGIFLLGGLAGGAYPAVTGAAACGVAAITVASGVDYILYGIRYAASLSEHRDGPAGRPGPA